MLYEDPEKIRKHNENRIRTVRRINYLCGINIAKQSSLKNIMNVHAIFLILMSTYSVYGHCCYIVIHSSELLMITGSLPTLLQTTLSIVKLAFMVFAQKRIYEMMKTVTECELVNETNVLDKGVSITRSLRSEVKDLIEESWKSSKYQVRFYVIACSTIISFFFFNAIIINTYHYIVGTPNFTKLFAFKTAYPGWELAKNHSPYYEFFTLVEGCADFIAGMVAVGFDGLYVFMTYHAVALFKILKKMIIYSTSENIPRGVRTKFLRECVIFYSRIIRYCDNINYLYSTVNLVQLLISLIVLGVVLFQASIGLETDPKIFIHMVLYISAGGSEIVIYCYDGQNLTTESETIPDAWYSCKWYDESREFKKIVYMMMIRSSRSYYISAWGFTTMTLPTFMGIAKTSGSYFMILRNLNQ